MTITSVRQMLNIPPEELDMNSFDEQKGIYGGANCKICNSEYRFFIDHLIRNGISQAQVVKYCNKYELFGDRPLGFTNVGNHNKSHIITEKQIANSPKSIEQIQEKVKGETIDGILEHIIKKAALPYYLKETPTLKEGLAAAKILEGKAKDNRDAEMWQEAMTNIQLKNKKLKKEIAPVIEVTDD